MKRINDDQIEALSKLLAECFINDPLVAYQVKGIANRKEFLKKLFYMQLNIYSKTSDVFVLNKLNTSVLVGYEKKQTKWFKQLFESLMASSKLRREISKENYKTYRKNLGAVFKEINLNWQKEFIDSNYYHLNIIAVASEERGKGNARKLITSVTNLCHDKNIPVTLETANANQIELYKHLGFDLIKTISGDRTGINQYCFIMRHKG